MAEARSEQMPKENIERAIKKATESKQGDFKEIIYEGTECDAQDGIPYKKGKPVSKYKDRDITKVAEPVRVVFELETMRGLVASYGKYFEIYDKSGKLYRFHVDGQKVYKVQQVVKLLGRN